MDAFLQLNHQAVDENITPQQLYGSEATLADFGLTEQLLLSMEDIFDNMVEKEEYDISNDTRDLFIRCLVYFQYLYYDRTIKETMDHISKKTRTSLPQNMNNMYEYFKSISTESLVIFGW